MPAREVELHEAGCKRGSDGAGCIQGCLMGSVCPAGLSEGKDGEPCGTDDRQECLQRVRLLSVRCAIRIPELDSSCLSKTDH